MKLYNVCEKDIWNPATRNCKNGKYVGSIIDDSVITCCEIIEATKAVSTKTVLIKSTSTIILLVFLLITISLLMAVSNCCYLIKYQVK